MADIWLRQLRAFFEIRAKNLGNSGDDFAINGYKAPGRSYWTSEMQQELIDDIIAKLKLLPQSVVLDVGCGTGLILRSIAPLVNHITGVDMSNQMLQIARTNSPPNAQLRRGSANALPFRAKSFDRVLCYNVVLNFLDDNFTWSVLDELVRVTRNGGFVLVGWIPDYEKREEQADVIKRLGEKNAWSNFLMGQFTRLKNRSLGHIPNPWRDRVPQSAQPSLGNRFYTKEFFTQYAKKKSCNLEIIGIDVEGFPYAPFHFDARLWPTTRTGA